MNIHDSERVQVLAERPDDVITSLALLNNLHHSLVFHELPQRDRISKDRDREMLLDTSIRRGSNRIKIEEEKEKQSVGVAIRSWSPSLLIARNVLIFISFIFTILLFILYYIILYSINLLYVLLSYHFIVFSLMNVKPIFQTSAFLFLAFRLFDHYLICLII